MLLVMFEVKAALDIAHKQIENREHQRDLGCVLCYHHKPAGLSDVWHRP
jgi:hypothetical protein